MPADEKPISSVWTRKRRQREQPALSQERIVAEAVRLLDAEGIENLSMRSLGTRLGAGATSLYRHVANKDELIELVVDEIYGELEVPDAPGRDGWREAVTEAAHSIRTMALRHPWFVAVAGQVGLIELGPNVMRMSERMIALLEGAGFGREEASLAMNAVIAYVMGATTSEAAYLSMIARSGKSEEEWTQSLWASAKEVAEDHPRLQEEYATYQGKDPRQLREDNFAYGLERVLDGLETQLSR